MRSVGRAISRYAENHDGHLPYRLEDLLETHQLQPDDLVLRKHAFLSHGVVFWPHEDVSSRPEEVSYVYLGKGKRISDDPQTVVMFDPRPNRTGFGGDGVFILYLSGSTDWLLLDDAKSLLLRSKPTVTSRGS